jgi:hypothetical protein
LESNILDKPIVSGHFSLGHPDASAVTFPTDGFDKISDHRLYNNHSLGLDLRSRRFFLSIQNM